MKHHLFLECIGYQSRVKIQRNPYVAEILDRQFTRRFLEAQTDFRNSTASGHRGVRKLYILESDTVYEVCEVVNWSKFRRFWIRISENGMREETKRPAEVLKWL